MVTKMLRGTLDQEKSSEQEKQNCLRLLQISEIEEILQNAIVTLIELQPENPIKFLALDYEWEPDKISPIQRAEKLIKQIHYTNSNFIYKLHRAYLILNSCPTRNELRGLIGEAHMSLLKLLTKDLEESEVSRVLDRFNTRANEVVSFSVFRSTVVTCLILCEYLKETRELFALLDVNDEGQVKRKVCDAILTRLWDASLKSCDDEARKLLSDENELEKILSSTAPEKINERKISLDRFLSQAVDIFLMKISDSSQ